MLIRAYLKSLLRDERQGYIARIFRDHQDWCDNPLMAEEASNLQVAAVFMFQPAEERT